MSSALVLNQFFESIPDWLQTVLLIAIPQLVALLAFFILDRMVILLAKRDPLVRLTYLRKAKSPVRYMFMLWALHWSMSRLQWWNDGLL
jgi:hypothetical protein